jgi:tetratricopeptide (TPR) repeat protein
VISNQASFSADLPMPADKTVAVPADPEQAPAAAAPAAIPAPASASDAKPYAEEALKHYNRGVELHQAGFLNQAIAEYKAAIDSDGRMEEAWSNLGGIYAAQRSYPKAMEAFEKALAIKPDRPTTLNGYGTVLYARGKTSEAKEKWKQAVTIEPGFGSAYYNMANALEGEKDTAGALSYYYLAIQASPNMADAYYRMGSIYLKEHHLAAAKVLITKSTDLSPDAEFAREAKKQVTAIDAQLASDLSDKQDVQMNVIVPSTKHQEKASAHVEDAKTTATASVTPKETKQSKPAKEHHGLFGGGGGSKKKKKEKNVDMFVQSSEKKPTESDLTEKPTQ